ncbi:DUF6647 family protein [Tabrizicola sp.]|uniref:DUF6647 family protein n=1 Tax=Tabrizicola sp. TaxID=2005166 RepID=UPI003F39D652
MLSINCMKELWIILALAQTGFALPAQAGDLCPLVAELNTYLTANSNYDAVACPEIGFSALPAEGAMRSQAGAYFPDTGDIELAADLDLEGAYGQSFLLHEMVHAAQFAAGADQRVRCPAELEAEAYRLQAGFLRDNGLSREAMLTDFLASQLGSCGAGSDY